MRDSVPRMRSPWLAMMFLALGCEEPAEPGQPGTAGEMGTMGEPGQPGTNGAPGQSVTVTAETTGANCAHGGVKLQSASGTSYVCHGAPAITAYGSFHALMPGDNSATVAVGAAVDFPQNGPISAGIARTSVDMFTLSAIGTYEVSWQVSVTEPGQLVLALDSGAGAVELAHTVVGRATGTSQISGHVLITTTVIDSVLSVRNPTGNSTALTITPLAGGTRPVSATLVIKRIS